MRGKEGGREGKRERCGERGEDSIRQVYCID